jgi:membrane-associated HD superfamily phosphohydrolase
LKKKLSPLILAFPFLALLGAALCGILLKGSSFPWTEWPLLNLVNWAKEWELSHLSGLLPFFPLLIAGWEQRHRPFFAWRNEIGLFLVILYLAGLTVSWIGCSNWFFNYSDHFALKTTTAAAVAGTALMASQLGPLSRWNCLFILLYSLSDFFFLSRTAHRYHSTLEVLLGLLVGMVLIGIAILVTRRIDLESKRAYNTTPSTTPP